MDSIKLVLNLKKKLKRRLGIEKSNNMLEVLVLWYSNEKIVNLPVGYEVPLHWNRMDNTPAG